MKFLAVAALVAVSQAITIEHRPSIDHIFYEQPTDWLEKIDKKIGDNVITADTKE